MTSRETALEGFGHTRCQLSHGADLGPLRHVPDILQINKRPCAVVAAGCGWKCLVVVGVFQKSGSDDSVLPAHARLPPHQRRLVCPSQRTPWCWGGESSVATAPEKSPSLPFSGSMAAEVTCTERHLTFDTTAPYQARKLGRIRCFAKADVETAQIASVLAQVLRLRCRSDLRPCRSGCRCFPVQTHRAVCR